MPNRPLWLDRLPEAIQQLENAAEPWVDRPTLESLLRVGRRRATTVDPLAQRRVGTSLVADRADVVAHLRRIAAGEEAYYEQRRQQQLWAHLTHTRREWATQPPVLVEVSNDQVRRVDLHDFDGLADGVELAPGFITVRFREPDEALEKLMALAIAIGRNQTAFEERVAVPNA
jgi:hypothetical protein